MFNVLRGRMPDITPAQLVGLLLPGVAITATLLRVFGVIDLNDEQIKALQDAVQWSVIGGGALFLSDAGLRAARNAAESKVEAASMAGPENVNAAAGATVALGQPIAGQVGHFEEGVAGPALAGDGEGPELEFEPLLPSDAEEFAAPPVSALAPDREADELPEV